jgi:hypothetical protein
MQEEGEGREERVEEVEEDEEERGKDKEKEEGRRAEPETRAEIFNRIFKKRIARKLRSIERQNERKPRTPAEIENFFKRHLRKKEKMEKEGPGMMQEEGSSEEDSWSGEGEDEEDSEEEAYLQLRKKKSSVYDRMGPGEEEEGTAEYLGRGAEGGSREGGEGGRGRKWAREEKALARILEKIKFFVSHKDPGIKLLVLEIAKKGLQAIAETNFGKFLPLVHVIWEPLKFRFLDQDPRVGVRALEVMKVMAKGAREFVSKKVADDLWPVLREKIRACDPGRIPGATDPKRFNNSGPVLPRHTKKIQNFSEFQTQYSNTGISSKTREISLKFGVAFKTQLSALGCLVEVCTHVDLPDETIREVARTCAFYLEEGQPKELKGEAGKLFGELERRDPDFVWLLLNVESGRGEGRCPERR